ncbi:hypothetical protein F4860DRAFT_482793 [Xylaria cubensis]|nr:hypothetical protein F4860DRAFT_482793 [Xylaria cubensis]
MMRIYEETMGEHVRLRLFKDALKGLKHMHAHGILHRAISSKNLLVFSSSNSSSRPYLHLPRTRVPVYEKRKKK